MLDEAQAIKNAGTESAKAVRLLRGAHRLALSGTPVENHLGELWSLFEFLNPGMLGAASVFKLAGGAARNPDEETRRLLAHALRPFILRRTKEQVARELPAKTEQTIYLRDGTRATQALQRAAPALPRLAAQADRSRGPGEIQDPGAGSPAAAAPGRLPSRPARHPKRSGEPSAKLDVLLEQLREVSGRRPQGAGVLAVHQPAGDRARPPGQPTASSTSIWTAPRATARRAWSASRTIRTAGSS